MGKVVDVPRFVDDIPFLVEGVCLESMRGFSVMSQM